MKRFLSLALFLVLFLTGCGSAITPAPITAPVSNSSRPLIVFAAASLTDAFTEIGKAFETANAGVTVIFNFAGSQALRTQIEEGAPADVFASANTKEMDSLVSGGFVPQTAPQFFLTNRLVVILPADNPAGLEKLEDLATPGIKLVLAAEEVPVGNYSRQALDLMKSQYGIDFTDKVLTNIVSNEDNVKQVVAKVQLGEADAGIVYKSDAIAAPDLKSIEIPNELNVIAQYPLAPLSQSANADVAGEFVAYVLSTEGQAILQKWGFEPVE
jgi:molybdate transport system substrate-binding protein